jgi:hypothetical protein
VSVRAPVDLPPFDLSDPTDACLKADVHRYLAFSLPAAAAVIACVLWILLPPAQIHQLMVEGGSIENWTLFAYGAAIVATCLCLHLAENKVAAGALLLILVFLGAREMDLHLSVTGTSILRLSFYLAGAFTLQKAAALAILALFVACLLCVWLRHGVSLNRDFRAASPGAVAAVAFGVTAAVAKLLDRTVSVLKQDFGLPVTDAASALVVSVEEMLELALPLIVMMAAAQFALARRRESRSLPVDVSQGSVTLSNY